METYVNEILNYTNKKDLLQLRYKLLEFMKDVISITKNNCPEHGIKCLDNKVTKYRGLLHSSPYFIFNFTWENPRPLQEEIFKVIFMIPIKFDNKMVLYVDEER